MGSKGSSPKNTPQRFHSFYPPQSILVHQKYWVKKVKKMLNENKASCPHVTILWFKKGTFKTTFNFYFWILSEATSSKVLCSGSQQQAVLFSSKLLHQRTSGRFVENIVIQVMA